MCQTVDRRIQVQFEWIRWENICPTGEEFNPKCTKATVKHDPISINVWGCMTSAGTGPIYRVKGMLDRHQYVDDILDGVVRPFVEQTLEEDWVFQVFLSFTRKNSFF